MDLLERTVSQKITWEGIGLHTGQKVKVSVCPQESGKGILFQKMEHPHVSIPAHPQSIVDTTLSMTLGQDGVQIKTVEHLLAALKASEIDNAKVEVHGDEIPILDGSSAPFWDLIHKVGTLPQNKERFLWIPKKSFRVTSSGDSQISWEPGHDDSLEVDGYFDFSHISQFIGVQKFHWVWKHKKDFLSLYDARTFCHIGQVKSMQERGLALGGSLENAVVVNDTQILNKEGLRHPDEFARHKILDALGDLSLLGGRMTGRLILHKSGHALHGAFVKKVFEQKEEQCLFVNKQVNRPPM